MNATGMQANLPKACCLCLLRRIASVFCKTRFTCLGSDEVAGMLPCYSLQPLVRSRSDWLQFRNFSTFFLPHALNVALQGIWHPHHSSSSACKVLIVLLNRMWPSRFWYFFLGALSTRPIRQFPSKNPGSTAAFHSQSRVVSQTRSFTTKSPHWDRVCKSWKYILLYAQPAVRCYVSPRGLSAFGPYSRLPHHTGEWQHTMEGSHTHSVPRTLR
jgi:hypothetical protein